MELPRCDSSQSAKARKITMAMDSSRLAGFPASLNILSVTALAWTTDVKRVV
jgi:hypothetical protein